MKQACEHRPGGKVRCAQAGTGRRQGAGRAGALSVCMWRCSHSLPGGCGGLGLEGVVHGQLPVAVAMKSASFRVHFIGLVRSIAPGGVGNKAGNKTSQPPASAVRQNAQNCRVHARGKVNWTELVFRRPTAAGTAAGCYTPAQLLLLSLLPAACCILLLQTKFIVLGVGRSSSCR